MDSEQIAEALARLEARDEEKDRRIDKLEEGQESWNLFLRNIMVDLLKWVVGLAITGTLLGFHLPEGMRKDLVEWISK